MKSKKKMTHDRERVLRHIQRVERDPASHYLVAYDQKKFLGEIETGDEQRLEELIQLLDPIKNVYFRALYHYAKWKLRNDGAEYKEAVKAAELFEEGADLALKSGLYFLLHQNLDMALSLNKSLGYDDEVKRLVSKVVGNMKILFERTEHRWNIEHIRLFLEYDDFKENNWVEEVSAMTCQILVELYRNRDLHHLLDTYTDLAVKLSKLRHDEKKRRELISRLAEHYRDYSKGEEPAITRLTALRRALELYKVIDGKKEIEETKAEMALLKDDLQSEMRVYEFKIPLKQEIIDDFLRVAEETEDERIPALIGECSYFVPDKEEMIRIVEETPSLAGMLMSTVVLSEGNPIAELRTPEDRLNYEIHQFYRMVIIQDMYYIGQIMKALIEKNKLGKSNIMDFFSANPDVFSDRSLRFVEDGVGRYFAGDFVGAIHVLVPQIEAVLRSMMQRIQIATTVLDRGGIREGDLGSYLINPLVRERILGEDFAIWLRVFLTEKAGGLNVRNYLAHGLVDFNQLTPDVASGILFVLLRLSSLQIVEQVNV
jgi:hypothetical protein